MYIFYQIDQIFSVLTRDRKGDRQKKRKKVIGRMNKPMFNVRINDNDGEREGEKLKKKTTMILFGIAIVWIRIGF